jgi:TolB-like protein
MGPSRDEVGHQLDRLLASEMFANADRASRFLRYVVERTLAGDGDRLKEFVIGVDVFDRDDQYDPRIDSIVRVEAGRLRSKLDQYYSRATADDRVVIHMARGSYVPAFEYRTHRSESTALPTPEVSPLAWPIRGAVIAGLASLALIAVLVWSSRPGFQPPAITPEGTATPSQSAIAGVPGPEPSPGPAPEPPPRVESRAPRPHAEATSREPHRATPEPPASIPEPPRASTSQPGNAISLVVLPFEHFSTDREVQLLAARFTDGVTSELARIEHVSVVSRTSALQLASEGRTLRDIARALDAQVVVEGSLVVEGTRVHADVRLVDTVVDRKSWSRQFAADVSDLRALQQRVAADVAAFIAPSRATSRASR